MHIGTDSHDNITTALINMQESVAKLKADIAHLEERLTASEGQVVEMSTILGTLGIEKDASGYGSILLLLFVCWWWQRWWISADFMLLSDLRFNSMYKIPDHIGVTLDEKEAKKKNPRFPISIRNK